MPEDVTGRARHRGHDAPGSDLLDGHHHQGGQGEEEPGHVTQRQQLVLAADPGQGFGGLDGQLAQEGDPVDEHHCKQVEQHVDRAMVSASWAPVPLMAVAASRAVMVVPMLAPRVKG